MNFGFSYVGLIYLLMLFIPNILWSKNKPKDYEKYVVNENKILLMFERIGEVLVSCFVLIFSDFNINEITLWSLWLFVSFVFMILYEIYWVRYFKSQRLLKDFYSSLLGIPVAFLLLGIYGKNIFLIISAIILGIGHIGVHINHYNEIKQER
ncbi:MAG TPA: hypothetical protein DD413_02225 [Ruminococcus sp.]|nr:hypothetical protein [Ruminococcus sp.]